MSPSSPVGEAIRGAGIMPFLQGRGETLQRKGLKNTQLSDLLWVHCIISGSFVKDFQYCYFTCLSKNTLPSFTVEVRVFFSEHEVIRCL
jgi:hypothetical protein